MTIKIAYNIKKPKFGRQIQVRFTEVYLWLPLNINRSATKTFRIKTNAERTDSRKKKTLGKSNLSFPEVFQLETFCYRPIYVKWQYVVNLTSNLPAKLWFFDVVGNFDSHIQIPPGFLH